MNLGLVTGTGSLALCLGVCGAPLGPSPSSVPAPVDAGVSDGASSEVDDAARPLDAATVDAKCPFVVRHVRSATFLAEPGVLVTSATAGSDGVTDEGVAVYDSMTGSRIRSLNITPGHSDFYWSTKANTLVVVKTYMGAHPYFINARGWKLVGEASVRCSFGLSGLVSRNGTSFFAACDNNETLLRYDLRDGRLASSFSPAWDDGATGKMHHLIESADGSILYHEIWQHRTVHAHSARTMAFLSPGKESPGTSQFDWLGASVSEDGRRVFARDRAWLGLLNPQATRRMVPVRPMPTISVGGALPDEVRTAISDDGKFAAAVVVSMTQGTANLYLYDASMKQVGHAIVEPDVPFNAVSITGNPPVVVYKGEFYSIPGLRKVGTRSQSAALTLRLANGAQARLAEREVYTSLPEGRATERLVATLPAPPEANRNNGSAEPWMIAREDGRILVLPSPGGALQLVSVAGGQVLEWLEYYDGTARRTLVRQSDGFYDGDERALACLPKRNAPNARAKPGLLGGFLSAAARTLVP